jgi:hypothetical protein
MDWKRMLGGLVLLLATGLATADEPKPLTPEQQEKLKEALRHYQEWQALAKAGKLAEAVAAGEKTLVIARDVLGDKHPEVANVLEMLAGVQERREDWAAARQRRHEVVQIRTVVHGKEDWRVTDARLALAQVDRLSRLTAEESRQLARAGVLNAQAVQLSGQGKAREALAPA